MRISDQRTHLHLHELLDKQPQKAEGLLRDRPFSAAIPTQILRSPMVFMGGKIFRAGPGLPKY